ncbi:heavy-metal-associated domain-containing protein [Streptococcus iniae]|nr:carbonate dehydratase [Streptococcus iniae]
MEKTYTISGMKCQGCAKNVKDKLEAVPGVKRVRVDLDNKQVFVQGFIWEPLLKRALASSKFSLTKYQDH